PLVAGLPQFPLLRLELCQPRFHPTQPPPPGRRHGRVRLGLNRAWGQTGRLSRGGAIVHSAACGFHDAVPPPHGLSDSTIISCRPAIAPIIFGLHPVERKFEQIIAAADFSGTPAPLPRGSWNGPMT